MLGWLTAKCPLDLPEKVWVERRMRWLAGRFGLDRMRKARVLLPTDEFFPSDYQPDEEHVRICFDLMCGYMGIDPATVTLEIVVDEAMPGIAGLYEQRERSNICVAQGQLNHPPQLLSTIAHELAHELLLKGGHITTDVEDHEQVTDLLPIFLGAGIFAANTTVVSQTTTYGNWSYFSISKHGYLSSTVLGYALALFAFVRGERKPKWIRHLRTDAAVTMRAGLRFLRRHGDSLFLPETADRPWAIPNAAEVIEQLESRSPTVRLSALCDVVDYSLTTAEVLSAVEKRLDDPNGEVQRGAVRALGAFGASATGSIPRLIQATWHGTDGIRVTALQSLGAIGTATEEVIPVLAGCLESNHVPTVCAAAGALARYGPAAASADRQLLRALEAAAKVNSESMAPLVSALLSIAPDARSRVRTHFAGRDPEVLRNALGAFRELGA